MRKLTFVCCSILVFMFPTSDLSSKEAKDELFQRSIQDQNSSQLNTMSVVEQLKYRSVEIEYSFEEMFIIPITQSGSGFIIETVVFQHPQWGSILLDRILTNAHVVSPVVQFPDIKIKGTFGQSYATYHLSYFDRDKDIAIIWASRALEPNSPNFKKVDLSNDVSEGDDILIVASPSGLTGTLSKGYISAKRDISNIPHLQFTAPSAPGSSGAGVFKNNGELVAVLNSGLKDSNSFNFGISVPDNKEYFRDILSSHNENGFFKIGSLNYFIGERVSKMAQALGMYEGAGEIFDKLEFEDRKKIMGDYDEEGFYNRLILELDNFEKKYADKYFKNGANYKTWIAVEKLKFSEKRYPVTFSELVQDKAYLRLRLFPLSYDDFKNMQTPGIGYYLNGYERYSAIFMQNHLALILHFAAQFESHPEYLRILAILAQEKENDELFNESKKRIYKYSPFAGEEYINLPESYPVSYYLESLMNQVMTYQEFLKKNPRDDFDEDGSFQRMAVENNLEGFFNNFLIFNKKYRDYVLQQLRNKGWDLQILKDKKLIGD